MTERVRIAAMISGRGSNMAALVDAARASDCPYEIALVASNDPEAAGLRIARDAGIATFAHSNIGMKRIAHEAVMDATLRDAGIEWIALAGYMRLLSAGFVDAWAGRIVNVHPSLLPAYKGLETHARAIAAGEPEAGCTVHIVTAALDDGPILDQARVPILPGDTPDTLAARVLVQEHLLYPRALADLVRRRGSPE